jgi:hypothetical protein
VWLAVFPAVALVVTDLLKNTALMQIYIEGSMTFFNIRTALIGLVFDKVVLLILKVNWSNFRC